MDESAHLMFGKAGPGPPSLFKKWVIKRTADGRSECPGYNILSPELFQIDSECRGSWRP